MGNSFEFLNRGCVGKEEFFLKALYLSLSAFSILCVSVVLLRIAYKHRRHKAASSIGRLVEHLVVVQGVVDITFHLVDLLFALDCNAPPLFILLTKYHSQLYVKPTVAYNIVKESVGYMSLLCHTYVAYSMCGWIVRKVSAGRLRRHRLPLMALMSAAIGACRFLIYFYVREDLVGIYVSSILYDVILIPGTVTVMLYFYFLTVRALGEHREGESAMHQLDSQQLQTRSAEQQQQEQQQQRHHSVDFSDQAGPTSSGGGGSGAGLAVPSRDGTGVLLPSSTANPGEPPALLSSSSSRLTSSELYRGDALGRSSGRSSGSSGPGAAGAAEDGGDAGGSVGGEQHSAGTGSVATSSRVSRRGGSIFKLPSFYDAMVPKHRSKNLTIIRRLLRISASVCLVWIMLAGINVYTWVYFYLHGNAEGLHTLLLVRLVCMRLVGTVDAIFLGDLFVVCKPCVRSCRRLWRRGLRRLTLPISPAVGGRGGGADVSSLGAPSFLQSRVQESSAYARRKEVSSVSRFLGGFGERARSSFRLLSTGSGGSAEAGAERFRDPAEEEAAALLRLVEQLQRTRAPQRQMKSLEIWASTWNMGGVDKESCGLGGSGKENVLRKCVALWVPRGYDLYVVGVQESQALRELREAIHAHLGGPEAYAMFGNEIGSDVILHGLIAVTLFVRTADVARGHFRLHHGVVNRVAAGVSLGPLGQAANKGMVGLSCRIYDTSLAVIGAHFASDKKGRNRVAKRNEHACTALRGLSLHWDSDDYDAHLQFHHTIMLGDLNYRMSGSPLEVLSLLSRTAVQQQQQLAAAAQAIAPAVLRSPVAADAGRNGGGEGLRISTSPVGDAAVAAATGANWRAVSYARLFQLPASHRFLLGSTPELPPCLATRRAPSIPPVPLLPTSTSGGTLLSLEPGASWISGSVGSIASMSPRPGQAPTLFSAKTWSSVGGLRSMLGEPAATIEEEEPPASSTTTAAEPSLEPTEASSTISQQQQQPRQQGSPPRQEGGPARPPHRPSPLRTERAPSPLDGSSRATTPKGEASGPADPPRSNVNASNVSSLAATSSSLLSVGGGGDDPNVGLWGWTRQMDELTRSMRDRLVFYSFREAALTFPPSYRWSRVPAEDYLRGFVPDKGGLAGDYTDLARLEAVYSTFVAHPPRLFSTLTRTFSGSAPPSTSPRDASDRLQRQLQAAAGGGGSGEGGAVVAGTSRTPSYTDRILTHSLPGKASQLRWRGYEMCDDLGLSDHRPVASHLTLFVDADCRGFQDQEREASGMGGHPYPNDLALFTITLAHPHVKLESGLSILHFALSSSHEVAVMFPLTSEDPIPVGRKASSLGEAMPGIAEPSPFPKAGLRRGSSTSSLSHFNMSHFPVRIRTVASVRFSEHLLMKISDSGGREIGQACIPVALGLRDEDAPAAYPHLARAGAGTGKDGAPAAAATAQAGGGGGGDGSTPPAGPSPAHGPPHAVAFEEVTAGPQHRAGKLTAGSGRRLKFPLTSGGAFKGWLTLDMRVKVKLIDPATSSA